MRIPSRNYDRQKNTYLQKTAFNMKILIDKSDWPEPRNRRVPGGHEQNG
jgi:hypothetical protein